MKLTMIESPSIRHRINLAMVVVENQLVRVSIKNILKNQEIFDITLSYGEAALELLKDIKVDVIIIEEELPGINGIELLRSIKRLYPRTKILFLVGCKTSKIENKTSYYGVEFVQSPINIAQFLNAISS